MASKHNDETDPTLDKIRIAFNLKQRNPLPTIHKKKGGKKHVAKHSVYRNRR